MHVEEDKLVCDCGRSVAIDECYNLLPDDKSDFPFDRIDQWYRWQQSVIAEEVEKSDFILKEDVTYKVLNLDDLKQGRFTSVGEGRVELDHENLRYIGTKNGEEVEYKFDISRNSADAQLGHKLHDYSLRRSRNRSILDEIP